MTYDLTKRPLDSATADALAQLSQADILGNLDDVTRLETMLGCTVAHAVAVLRTDCQWHCDEIEARQTPSKTL